MILHRLAVYQEQTAPLIAHYQAQGLLQSVEASGTVEEIAARISTLLN